MKGCHKIINNNQFCGENAVIKTKSGCRLCLKHKASVDGRDEILLISE